MVLLHTLTATVHFCSVFQTLYCTSPQTYCTSWLNMCSYTGHTPKPSLTLTVFSFDRGQGKSSWHLKADWQDKVSAVFLSLLWGQHLQSDPFLVSCSALSVTFRYVSFPCCCEVSISRAVWASVTIYGQRWAQNETCLHSGWAACVLSQLSDCWRATI